MEGKPWYVYVLRLLIAWLRGRIDALAAKIESSRRRKREGISSTPSTPSAAVAPSATERTGEATLAAKHGPSEAAATEEEAVETVEGVVSDQVDHVNLAAEQTREDATGDPPEKGTADDSPTTWPVGESLAFTPDASLDLVEDIEFAFEPEPAAVSADGAMVGWVQGDGSRECPESFPIKGNGTSHIYHLPGQASYAATIAELCFSTEEDAIENGYRPTKRNRPSS